MNRRVVFESSAFEDFNDWAKLDKKLYKKIVELIKDIDRSPFSGMGKPEPLKHEFRKLCLAQLLLF
jgi:toxin YoeB